MRNWLLLLGLLAAFAPPAQADDLVYFGTRNDKAGEGIFAARFDAATGKLTPIGTVAVMPRPTLVIPHPSLPVVYAVSELGNEGDVEASVSALAVDKTTGQLKPLNTVRTGGGATDMSIDTVSKSLFVANYGAGQLSWLPILPDGKLGMVTAIQATYGQGPDERQDRQHPHGVRVDPSHHFVLVADLGADKVFVFRFDAATRQLVPAQPGFAATAIGSGPRQLAFHPNGQFLYVLNQINSEVLTYRWDAKLGRLTQVQALPTELPTFKGVKSAAHIEASADGRFVYASNRGSDSLVVYAVNARKGSLSEVQRMPAPGKIPFGFALHSSGRWMVVTNNASNTASVFAVDPASGKLTLTAGTMAVSQPANVTFFPTS